MILLDTHVAVWALLQPSLLSSRATTALREATGWAMSAASLYEIRYKVLLGKWPEIADIGTEDLGPKFRDQGFDLIAADAQIMDMAGGFDWTHRDPFDRLIVATAICRSLPLLSKDRTLDTLPTPPFTRLW